MAVCDRWNHFPAAPNTLPLQILLCRLQSRKILHAANRFHLQLQHQMFLKILRQRRPIQQTQKTRGRESNHSELHQKAATSRVFAVAHRGHNRILAENSETQNRKYQLLHKNLQVNLIMNPELKNSLSDPLQKLRFPRLQRIPLSIQNQFKRKEKFVFSKPNRFQFRKETQQNSQFRVRRSSIKGVRS